MTEEAKVADAPGTHLAPASTVRVGVLVSAESLVALLSLGLVLIVVTVVYLPVLGHWFLADDFWFLRRARDAGWSDWLGRAWDFRKPAMPEFGEYRPLYLTTFKLEYALFGLNAGAYHAVNFALHVANVVLLWLLARKITGRTWAATVAALVFGAHPAYHDAIEWISNGNTLMATFFYLLAFLLFTKGADRGPRQQAWYAASVVSFTLAILYHPEALPLVVVIPAWYFLAGKGGLLHPADWAPLLPFVAVAVPYALLQNWVRNDHGGASAGLQLGPHVYNNYRDYLGLTLYPIKDPAVLKYVSLATATVGLVLLSQWRWSRLTAFVVVWYAVSVAPESLAQLGAYARLLYLPGAAFGLLVAVLLMRLVDVFEGHMSRTLRRWRSPLPATSLAGAAALVPLTLLLLYGRDAVVHDSYPPPDSSIAQQAEQNRGLVARLHGEVQAMPPGSTLYVAGAPANLALFDGPALDNMVKLYYGDAVSGRVVVDGPAPVLGPTDRLLIYER